MKKVFGVGLLMVLFSNMHGDPQEFIISQPAKKKKSLRSTKEERCSEMADAMRHCSLLTQEVGQTMHLMVDGVSTIAGGDDALTREGCESVRVALDEIQSSISTCIKSMRNAREKIKNSVFK